MRAGRDDLVARHGEQMLPEIERLAEAEGWALLSAGTLIADLLSGLRNGILDADP